MRPIGSDRGFTLRSLPRSLVPVVLRTRRGSAMCRSGSLSWYRWVAVRFRHIAQNGRRKPLTDRLAAVELIGATTTGSGLKVESALDARSYKNGIKISTAEMRRLDITGDQFHPE